jgi:2-oxoglutarate ferredoxin oxidoreductase subunit delta
MTTAADSDQATRPAVREIRINQAWCKSCAICVEFCKPQVLVMDGFYPVVVNPEACTGCLQCELLCPDFAIEVE